MKKKTPKKLMSDENDQICYWITVIESNGKDAFDNKELSRPVAVHHLIHKTKSSMRWCLRDLFAMKQGNHALIHSFGKEPEFVGKIIGEKGQIWFDNLHDEAYIFNRDFKMNLDNISYFNKGLKVYFKKVSGIDWEDFMRIKGIEGNKDFGRWKKVCLLWSKGKWEDL